MPELSDTVGSDQVTALPEDPTPTEKESLSGHTTVGGTLSTANSQDMIDLTEGNSNPESSLNISKIKHHPKCTNNANMHLRQIYSWTLNQAFHFHCRISMDVRIISKSPTTPQRKYIQYLYP